MITYLSLCVGTCFHMGVTLHTSYLVSFILYATGSPSAALRNEPRNIGTETTTHIFDDLTLNLTFVSKVK